MIKVMIITSDPGFTIECPFYNSEKKSVKLCSRKDQMKKVASNL